MFDAVAVIANVDLAESNIDARGRNVAECKPQGGARGGPCRVPLWFSGDSQRPRPGNEFPAKVCTALLERNCKQNVWRYSL